MAIKQLLLNPIFLLGCVIRFLLPFFFVHKAADNWYIPFIESFFSTPHLDAWGYFYENGGDILAFPYGFGMLLSIAPFPFVAKLLSLPLAIGYFITIFAFDIATFLILFEINPQLNKNNALILYWFSPIVLISLYLFGFNDIIPIFFLLFSFSLLKRNYIFLSAFFLVFSASVKLSMFAVFPFIAIFFIKNNHYRKSFNIFIFFLTCFAAVFFIPQILLTSFIAVIIANPEVAKLMDLSFRFSNGIRIYIIPIFYILSTYCFWRIKRIRFNLFVLLVGVVLFPFILFTTASLGWFVWLTPFFVLYANNSDKIIMYLILGFNFLFSIFSIAPYILELCLFTNNNTCSLEKILSMLNTTIFGLGIILMVRIIRESILNNDFFKLLNRSFVLGIAGDSGAGKDKTVENLISLFGSSNVTHISGDDYHKWDRNKFMWKIMTHLHPLANNLSKYTEDIANLIQGKKVYQQQYNHNIGKMMMPRLMTPNDFIITSGLHTFFNQETRNFLDLKVFLDIDENLRQFWKIQRDTQIRGHSIDDVIKSIKHRSFDAKHFIHPQKEYADLILSLIPLKPITNLLQMNPGQKILLGVKVQFKENLYLEKLRRYLVALSNCDISSLTLNQSGYYEFLIFGNPSKDDIRLIAEKLMPFIHDFICNLDNWQNGIEGIFQLILVCQTAYILQRRI